MEIRVEITADGKAKKLNPLGDKPNELDDIYDTGNDDEGFDRSLYLFDLNNWNKAESARKTYEVEPQICKCALEYGKCPTPSHCFWETGTMHTATIINETTVRITT